MRWLSAASDYFDPLGTGHSNHPCVFGSVGRWLPHLADAKITHAFNAQPVRGACNSFFFIGIAAVPLAEATALFFVAPVIITILSVIFLREKVGQFRWFATIMGLGDGRYATGDNVAVGFMFRAWVWPHSEDLWILGLVNIVASGALACHHSFVHFNN